MGVLVVVIVLAFVVKGVVIDTELADPIVRDPEEEVIPKVGPNII